jgi:hypothetical protein
VIVLLAAIALACAVIYRDFAQDDAFITYRYARNLVEGHGFVYNLAEPVLGTTTPLYTLLLALVGKITGQDIPWISHWVSIASLWLGGVALFYLSKPHGTLLAATAAALFISNPLYVSSIGMESFFLVCLLLFTLKDYVDRRFARAGVLLGFLLLTRYETVLLAALLGAHFIVRYRRIPYWMASAVVMLLLWAAFAWRTFGGIIPQSATAKLLEARIPFALGAVVWWHFFARQIAAYSVMIPLAVAGAYAGFRRRRYDSAHLLLFAWSGVYCVAASLYAGSFPWYYAPLVPGVSILAAWGIESVIDFLAALGRRIIRRESLARAFQPVLFAIVALSLIGLNIALWSDEWSDAGGQIVDTRYAAYREAADWLNRHAGGADTLAAEEIGVLGYYTRLKIIDLYGLVTPELTPWLAAGLVETLKASLRLHSPDYVLIKHEGGLSAVLDRSSSYSLVHRFAGDTYLLYARQGDAGG